MNVLFVTAYDLEGQQFNGYQIHKELLRRGHRSRMSVASYRSDDPTIAPIGSTRLDRLNERAVKLEKQLSLYSVLPVRAFSLYSDPWYREADIVHLQLLHALPFFSLLNLPRIGRGRRPVLLTLHDPWLTTGHCVHPLDCDKWLTGCNACPDLARLFPVARDTSAFQWRLKHWLLHHTDLTLIVASPWMREHVRRSPILSHLPCHVIPFGLDTSIFRPRDKGQSKASLGIPQGATAILFRNAPHYAVKGSDFAVKALASLNPSQPTYILALDTPGELDALRDKYRVMELGWVDDQERIATIVSAADLFLMPSLAETFGMMAVESLACGTPLIVFDGTSLPGIVDAPHGGVVVPRGDPEALADAIGSLLADPDRYRRQVAHGLSLVRQRYDRELYIERHLELYESLLHEGRHNRD